MHKFFVTLALVILLNRVDKATIAQVSDCSMLSNAITSGLSIQSLVVGTQERKYILYIPTQYDGTTPYPVVFSYHGFASDAQEQMLMSDFNTLADDNNFIAVYPQGLGQPPRWSNGTSIFSPTDNTQDVEFFVALLDTLETTGCIDSQRIYVNGFSAGGGMAYRLGCELADRITAIGTVAGAYAEIPNGCNPSRPLPIITLHGKVDPVVAYDGLGIILPNIPNWVETWQTRNECQAQSDLAPQGAVTGIIYSDCGDDVSVAFYTIADGGHTWAGTTFRQPSHSENNKVSQDINASQTMWQFFVQYRLSDSLND
jgi:polyhydroxybutyrate depolymerase